MPQLFVANHAERLPRKLPFVLLGSGLQRLPYPLIGLALLLFAVEAPALALLLFFCGIAIAAFGGGIVTPAWFTMIGKVIPTRRRGIFFGLADGGGLLMAVIGAYFVGRVLDIVDYPGSFALLFLVCGVFHAISWFSLSLTREPPSDEIKKAVPLRHYFRQLPTVLRHHANYRRFLIGYALLRLSMMSVSFFIVFGNINYELSGADIGLLNAIFIGTQAVMRLLFGWLGDRWGHKRNLVISAACMVLAAASALTFFRCCRADTRVHLPRLRHLQRYGFAFQYRAGVRRSRRSTDLYRFDQYLDGAVYIHRSDLRRLGREGLQHQFAVRCLASLWHTWRGATIMVGARTAANRPQERKTVDTRATMPPPTQNTLRPAAFDSPP